MLDGISERGLDHRIISAEGRAFSHPATVIDRRYRSSCLHPGTQHFRYAPRLRDATAAHVGSLASNTSLIVPIPSSLKCGERPREICAHRFCHRDERSARRQ